MTYPPGPPSGPGFGGDPNAHGQQPQDAAWWDHPTQAQPDYGQQQQPTWTGQPVDQSGWQQPQAGQPAWTGSQGYPQQAGYQQGYPQQPGFPQQGFPPPQPPKSKTGLIVGIVLGIVAVLAVAVGAIVFVTKDDSSNTASSTTKTTATTTTSSSSVAPTTAPTTSSKPPAAAGGRFSYTEYGQDWNFKLGNVQLSASWVGGHDYDTCAPIEKAGKLTSLGCQTASVLTWRTEGGAVLLTQLVLGMRDSDSASGADGQFTDDDLNLPSDSVIADFATGKWKDGSQGKFLVVTVGTATNAVDVPTVEKYLKYRHSDTLAALIWR
ncbi:hypothetical protein ACIP5Y_28640 [Nocardia sp. NPDC088792]|uniref:hypothetical protein n=1 Tax=Nocardia sp. NPDC088792 TaxID=3364332 RepID=UPI0038275311